MPTERSINRRRGNATRRSVGGSELISAAEIACYFYCPEQWRLQYGLELLLANREALDAGTRHHEVKAVAERVAGRAIGIGRMLIVVALVLVLLLWLVWRRFRPGGSLLGPSEARSERAAELSLLRHAQFEATATGRKASNQN
jgi:hypothetical protein